MGTSGVRADAAGPRSLGRPRTPPAMIRSSRTIRYVLAALALLAVGLVAIRLGPELVILAVAGASIGLLLLTSPRWAAALVVLVVVVCETSPDWGVPILARPYAPIASGIAPVDVLLLTATAAVLLQALSRRRLRLPTPLGIPLALMLTAFVFGVLNGVLGGGAQGFQVLTTTLAYAPLFLIPLIIVNVVDPGADLDRTLLRAGGLAVFKAVAGLAVVYGGIAAAAGPGLPPLTYYAPTGNLCMMAFLLVVLAARLSGVRVPRSVDLITIVVAVALLLSYRRTFWLGTLLAVAVVVIVATRRETRRLIVPALLVLLLAGVLVARAGIGGGLVSGELGTRITSLTPSKVSANDQDRYRLTERRNVVAELDRRPLTGIGVGVGWKQRYPVNIQEQFLDYYVHAAVLWHWLKEGVLGLVAYLVLYGAAFACGLQVFRRHEEPWVRAFGLGAGATFLGLAVVEAASTTVGSDVRGTLVAGVLLGLLAVAHRGLPPREAPGATV